ncbi:MAG: acetolactate decarboxylase [Lachnospiraceae bacterium]|nr:acetolactate decarboxylase [Lachnospiraceae bacterium]
MKDKKVLIPLVVAVCIFFTGCQSSNVNKDVLYQVDLLQSLTLGQYDGVITVEELAKHGDIGIGTFEGVNGEMIVLDGVVYQALGDGSVVVADSKEKVPYATVTYMDKDIEKKDFTANDISDLKNKLDEIVKENGINHFYMVRIDGKCNQIKVRSELKQQKPYKYLDEALSTDQREFVYDNSEGTIVGLYCPPYMDKLNSPGWHFHFISNDKKQGGHILELNGLSGNVAMDKFSELDMYCPDNEIFDSLDLTVNQGDRIKDVEQGK